MELFQNSNGNITRTLKSIDQRFSIICSGAKNKTEQLGTEFLVIIAAKVSNNKEKIILDLTYLTYIRRVVVFIYICRIIIFYQNLTTISSSLVCSRSRFWRTGI